jgi:hypothetical protein
VKKGTVNTLSGLPIPKECCLHYRKNLELQEVVISGNQLLSSLEEGFLPPHLPLTGSAIGNPFLFQCFPPIFPYRNYTNREISWERILGHKKDKRFESFAP